MILRFELNYETMQKVKLNDQFDFPFTLNMFPYTREGLDTGKKPKAADAKASDSKQSAPLNEESNCQYELTGVVVHTGVADGGHYYSYIKERFGDGRYGDWFEFNDSEVRPFSADSIANNCFGGIKMTEIYDEKSGKKVTLPLPKENNAYLLFYDRIERKPVETPKRDLPFVRKEGLSSLLLFTLCMLVLCSLVVVVSAALQVSLPPLIAQSVWAENSVIHRHRHVFDPKFFDFMWDFCHLMTPPLYQVSAALAARMQLAACRPHTFVVGLCRSIPSIRSKRPAALKWVCSDWRRLSSLRRCTVQTTSPNCLSGLHTSSLWWQTTRSLPSHFSICAVAA
jgi:hypothetical protein